MDWHSLEVIVNILLQGLGSWLEPPMQFFSFLGTEEFFLFIMPGLYWCISPSMGLRTAFALLFNSSVNAAIKILLHHPRPYWIDPRVRALGAEKTFGMPSNHAQSAVVIWGLLGFSTRKRSYIIAAFAVMFLIGFSRLYLGVHFLSDVLLGWFLGGLLLLAMIRLDRPVTNWLSRQPLSALLACSTIGAIVVMLLPIIPGLALQSWPIPQAWLDLAHAVEPIDPFSLDPAFTLGGTWLGMFSGAAWLYRKAGGFQSGGSLRQRALRYGVGLIGVLILWFGLGQIFPRTPDLIGYLLRFARYTLIGLWIALFAPLLFRRLRLIV